MNLHKFITAYVNILTVITTISSSRILGIITIPTYSHQAVFRQFWKELSLKGHQVVVLTTHPMNDYSLSNLTEIDLHSSYRMYNNKLKTDKTSEDGLFNLKHKDEKLIYKVNSYQLQHPKVQEMLKNRTEHFDVVFVEYLYPAMLQFSVRFNCPFIHILPFDAFNLHYHTIGSPSHPIANPDILLQLPNQLNFLERLVSVSYELFCFYFFNVDSLPLQQKLSDKYFDKSYPSPGDIIKNASMMFANINLLLHPFRPSMPNVIPIGGGLHFQSPKPLPKDLEDILDNSPNGVIYFSLGSRIKSEDLANDTIKILLEVFAEIPYVVLWKFGDDLLRKPNNVIISKWFPQQDILRHPNIKLFITQGGAHSIAEAIYYQVPIIGIPFIWDQFYNVRKIVSGGLGLSIDHRLIDKKVFKKAILELINDSKYSNKIKEMAKLAKYHPMTGLERAVWWTEFVIRHKGAKHLRSPALGLPIYQRLLLDVMGFCALIIALSIYLLIKSILLLRTY